MSPTNKTDIYLEHVASILMGKNPSKKTRVEKNRGEKPELRTTPHYEARHTATPDQ